MSIHDGRRGRTPSQSTIYVHRGPQSVEEHIQAYLTDLDTLDLPGPPPEQPVMTLRDIEEVVEANRRRYEARYCDEDTVEGPPIP